MRALVIVVFFAQTLGAQQLVTNGGFESGSAGWQASGHFSIGALSNPRSGSWYAYLSTNTGNPGNNLYGTLRQTFTIPNNITSASLRFYYSITSTDTTPTNGDYLTVFFEGTGTQHTFSNLNVTSGYEPYTFDLTTYAGQTLTIQFLGTTNSTNPTVFRIDDVSATYAAPPQPPNAPTNLQAVGNGSQLILGWTDNATNETNFDVERKPWGGAFVAWRTLNANITATDDTQGYGSTTCYRVRARNSGGTSNYTNEACATSLEPPTLLQPADNTTTSTASITMSWQSTPGANLYALDVGTTCGTNNILGTETLQTSYTHNFSAGTYVWRVRAANTTYPGLSQPSACRTFTVTNTQSPPVAGFTLTPQNPLVNDLVQFTDTSTGSPTSWTWNFGDGGTASVQHPTHTYTSTGTYTVTLTASNASGTDTESRPVTITAAVLAPAADFTYTPTSPLVAQTVTFTDTSTNHPTGWSWDFNNDGTIDSTHQHPNVSFTAAGTYTVKLTASNTAGISGKTKNITISTSVQAPSADFTYSPPAPTTSTPVQFTDTSTNNPTSWAWDFENNGSTDSTQRHPTHQYATTGNYTAKLTVSNAAGTTSKTRTIAIADVITGPVANFRFTPSSPAPGEPVTFTDISTNNPESWSWDFGDGSTASVQHPTHTFAKPDTYPVRLTVTNNAGNNTTSKNVVIAHAGTAPVASFSPSKQTARVGEQITFTDTSTGSPTSWFWNFGDNRTSTLQHPTYAYPKAGIYVASLVVTNVHGEDTATATLTITTEITIQGAVTTRYSSARIRGGTSHPRAVRLFDVTGKPTNFVTPLRADGTYRLTVPAGTYSAVCNIEYDNDIAGAAQPRTRSASARRNGCNGSAPCNIEFAPPLVFIHGLDVRPGGTPQEQRWTLWRNSVPSDVITFAPAYDFTTSIQGPADAVAAALDNRFALFTSTPRFNIIAHSKGGLVARVLRRTSRYAQAIHSAALLGTPNDGSNCFSAKLSHPVNLSWCDLVEGFNKEHPEFPGDVIVVAGTTGIAAPCFGEAGPSDGIVPVDSVFKITHIENGEPIAQTLDGVVIPEDHFELGTKETWLLEDIILPYFERTAPLPSCPASYVTRFSRCTIGLLRPTSSLCLGGRGVTAGGGCTIPSATFGVLGVKLQWQAPTVAGGAASGLQTTIARYDPCTAGSSHGGAARTGPTSPDTAPVFDGRSAETSVQSKSTAADMTLLGYYVLRSAASITYADPELRVGFTPPGESVFIDPDPLPGTNYYAVVAAYETFESGAATTTPVSFPTRRRSVRH